MPSSFHTPLSSTLHSPIFRPYNILLSEPASGLPFRHSAFLLPSSLILRPLLFLSLLATLSCLAAEPVLTGPREKLPPQLNPATIVVSRDGLRYAYIKRTVSSLVAVVDGKPEAPADWITNNLIRFSDDSKHTFYIARGRNDARVVVDGVAGPVYESVTDSLFTPHGRLMYLAKRKQMSIVVCDGAERAQLTRIRLGALADVADAAAFVEMADTGEQVYRGNQAQGVYQRVGDVRFSPDGRRLAYRAQQNGRWMIVVDGVKKPACDDVSGPAFSADSQRLGWLATRDGKTAMVVDDTETPLGSPGELSAPTLSGDGRAWMAAVRRDGKMQVYWNGKPLGAFGAIEAPVFSPDGQRLALVAMDGIGRNRVVLDGREMDAADVVYDLRFSADSKRFANVATLGKKEMLWVDGKIVGTCDGISPHSLAFSADARTYAAVAREGDGQRIVFQGGMTELFDTIAAGQPICIDAENNVHAFVVKGGQLMGLTVGIGNR